MGQNKQAFTLVELIVVATILVVLATMGFAAFSDSIPDARDAERKAAIAQIESALSSYHAERQVLPLPSTNYFELSL
jgi:prepilin-type N-terminal cleavage/methylation domain-containing protein